MGLSLTLAKFLLLWSGCVAEPHASIEHSKFRVPEASAGMNMLWGSKQLGLHRRFYPSTGEIWPKQRTMEVEAFWKQDWF